MKLEEQIKSFENYQKEFSEWEATEIIIDDKKAFYELKEPNSNYRKVCMFRDGCNIVIYGDYGSFTFDNMTWLSTPNNLSYDNINYQMEKLSHDSRDKLWIFDDYECEKDIKKWFKEKLECEYEWKLDKDNDNVLFQSIDNLYSKIIDFVDNCAWGYPDDYEVGKFCNGNGLEEIYDLIYFFIECLEHSDSDEGEWISFLRNADWRDVEEQYESALWKAGKLIHQRYFINMYAMKVCGEKLNSMKEE